MLAEHPVLAEDEQLRADMLDAELDFPEAIERIVKRLRKREAYAAANDALVSQYDAEAGRHRAAVLGQRRLILTLLEAAQIARVRLPNIGGLVSLAQSQPKVIITDEAAIPGELMRVTREPNKKAIGDRLKAGEAIPGACLSNAEPYVRIG
jgi:hypothetical protein